MPCGVRRDIVLKIVASSPMSLKETVLGTSSPFVAFGLNVRVFDDHIREAAFQHHLPHAIVLSYVMAHEIGHVLLRSGLHGRWGIMSSVWRDHEYEQMPLGALVFSNAEAKSMSANLRAPVCH